jgi:hypothetical protein
MCGNLSGLMENAPPKKRIRFKKNLVTLVDVRFDRNVIVVLSDGGRDAPAPASAQ